MAMATTPTVLGGGPLEYTDPNSGKQISIPLSALFFDPKKNNQLSVDSTKWPDPKATPVTLPPFVTSLLADLSQQQLILPAPVASPKPALIVTATDPGSAGNGIKLTIAITTPNVDPTQTVFSIKVEETDLYPGLTLSTIAQVLGTDKKAGTTPGLVHVVDGTLAASGLPAAVASQPFTQPAPPPPPPPPGPNAQSVLMNNAKVPAAFVTLEAKKLGADGALTVVTIANVDSTKNTFDLTAYWTKSATGIKLATLQSSLATLAYDIGGSLPPSKIFSVPAAGPVQLAGGTDGTSPTAASAVVFAGQ
jgi:hypothetical protein